MKDEMSGYVEIAIKKETRDRLDNLNEYLGHDEYDEVIQHLLHFYYHTKDGVE